ncbi:MAG: AbiV family abortive infection protein [Pseudobdellovibrio sp.]
MSTTLPLNNIDIFLAKKIYLNALELQKEAQILYEHKAYKRAFFLIYTSIEEITKLRIHLNTSEPIQKLMRHDQKNQVMKKHLKDFQKDNLNLRLKLMEVKKSILDFDITVCEFNQEQIKFATAEEIQEMKNLKMKVLEIKQKAMKEYLGFEELYKTDDVIHLRNSALYYSGFKIEQLDKVIYQLFYAYLNGYASAYFTEFKKKQVALFKFFST